MSSCDDVRRSGGKVTKKGRISAGKTPFDRPILEKEEKASNSWRKYVTSGASNLLSYFWNPKSWGERSSEETDSEVGIEDDMVDNENLSVGRVESKQNKGSSFGKSEILYLVEQLLMLEHYSREECDRLIEIMNSRVVDYTMKEGVDAAPKGPYTRRQAIMEARKVITGNMVGSSSKSDLDDGIHGTKSPMTSKVDYLSGGAWNIQSEIQKLHSKVAKPTEPISSEAPKPDDEIVNLVSEDMRTTQDDVPAEPLSSLPTIEEQNQMSEEKEKDIEDEFTEVPDVIASQGSSNTSYPKKPDSPTAKRASTRSRRYSRKGRGRGK